MINYLIFLVLSALISFAITPLVRSIAKRKNILDFPSERKIHNKPIPLLGGIPIFISFNLTLLIGYFLNIDLIVGILADKWIPILLCQIIILILGITDDTKKLQPKIKFLIQLFAGALLLLFGIGIYNITNPFSGGVIHLGILSIPITIFWVVGITNALNLVDGLDGLAAGTSFIVCITLFGIALFNQNLGIAFVSLILGGSILGFLKYNFHPAKIFLGDSGSLLLGFLLSVLSIQGSYKGATLVAVLAPILALGFPIIETLLSMIRRLLKSIHVIEYSNGNGKLKGLFFKGFSMFEADTDHVHHKLLKRGISHRRVVLILYVLCASLGFIAFVTVSFKNLNMTIFLAAIVFAFVIGIRSLNYQEFKILESGLLLPIFNFPVVNKRTFQAFIDLFVITLSFYLSFILVFKSFGVQERDIFIQALPFVLIMKISVFYFSGIYKGAWLYSSLEDILLIIRSLIISTVSTALFLVLFFGIRQFGGVIFFLIDFYLLSTFAIGYRISFRLVNSLYNRNSGHTGKKVLIYGAGHRGSIALKEMKYNGSYIFSPIGFIDDDIKKKGRIIHNCPILGTVEDIESLVKRNDVSEIIVSTDKINKDRLEKLLNFCRKKGIVMRQFEFRFYEFPQFESE